MKKHQSITAIFGATQQDMAMLLGIGVSHWSMYECGQRDLPLRAKELLAKMLLYMKEEQPDKQELQNYSLPTSKKRT